MTLTVPPPVQDPVPREVVDAVIKEARKRARRRRLRYAGVVAAVVLGVAMAWGPWDAVSSPDLPPGAVGPPPEDAAPSSLPGWELVAEIPSEHVRVWVFADGRLISMRMSSPGPSPDGWPNSGFLEQRLTPSGVDLLRSYVIAHAGGLVEETRPVDHRIRDVRVRVGDQLYHRDHEYGMSYWRCHWSGCEQYLTDLNSVLPASAWADKDYRRYVPSLSRVCFGGQTPDRQPLAAEVVRNAFPARARELLVPLATETDSSGDWGCAVVSADAAHAIEGSLQATAGFIPRQHVSAEYEFTIPPADGRDAIVGGITFSTVLPNGDIEDSGG